MKDGFTLRFSARALRRLAEGTKRAAVVRATQAAHLVVGDTVQAGADEVDARVPLRVVAVHPIAHLGELPALATALGLGLAEFTTLPDWASYQRASRRVASKAAALVVFAPAGPVSGTIPANPARPRKTADSVHGRPWHRVRGTVAVRPADQVHESDRAELRARITAAIASARPEPGLERHLELVVEAMLRSGRCGPAFLGRRHRHRLGARLGPALAWMGRHGLLVGVGPDRIWSRELLADLRINRQDHQTPGEHSG